MAAANKVEEKPCTPTTQQFPKLKALVRFLNSLDTTIDLETLLKTAHRLLEQLDVRRKDLEPKCIFDDDKYRRNPLLDPPHDHCDLVVICWKPGQRSSIHDHAGSACAFRVIEGVATETRFEPGPGPGLARRLRPTRQLPVGSVCCAKDADIHQVANLEPAQDLITLHLYVPKLHMNEYREVEDNRTSCVAE